MKMVRGLKKQTNMGRYTNYRDQYREIYKHDLLKFNSEELINYIMRGNVELFSHALIKLSYLFNEPIKSEVFIGNKEYNTAKLVLLLKIQKKVNSNTSEKKQSVVYNRILVFGLQ